MLVFLTFWTLCRHNNSIGNAGGFFHFFKSAFMQKKNSFMQKKNSFVPKSHRHNLSFYLHSHKCYSTECSENIVVLPSLLLLRISAIFLEPPVDVDFRFEGVQETLQNRQIKCRLSRNLCHICSDDLCEPIQHGLRDNLYGQPIMQGL